MKILLMAGHGDGDPGASALGYAEADLTREVVQDLADKLRAYATIEVFDTSKDPYKYLKTHMLDFSRYDYVVEIHFNAVVKDLSGNGKTTGSEILVHPAEQFVSVENRILDKLSAVGFTNRGVIPRTDLRNMNICRGGYEVSYALIEVCFIDDADDMKLYTTRKDDVIQAIADGIKEGFGLSKTENREFLVTPNDITWELNASFFPITDTDGFVRALTKAKDENSPLYWGYYKLVNEIK